MEVGGGKRAKKESEKARESMALCIYKPWIPKLIYLASVVIFIFHMKCWKT
jgi:hypothetical protein